MCSVVEVKFRRSVAVQKEGQRVVVVLAARWAVQQELAQELSEVPPQQAEAKLSEQRENRLEVVFAFPALHDPHLRPCRRSRGPSSQTVQRPYQLHDCLA